MPRRLLRGRWLRPAILTTTRWWRGRRAWAVSCAGATATWSGDADSPLGAFAITAGGHWTYTLDNGAADALAEGESATETFLVTVTDDYGATATETVTITITGTNDSPVITNAAAAAAGTVVEAGNLDDGTVVAGTASVSGQLSSSDVDHGATATWSGDADSPLGAFAITAGGHWTYTLDNGAADALAEGESATETFLVTVTDDYGATATETVTITITGTNDSPVITNAAAAAAGTVVEAGNLDDGTVVAGTASVSGQLSSSDVDHGATATWSGDADSPLGAFAITAGGHWTYTLDNGAADALAEGESATETFLVTVTDDYGATATETVTITITGTNDSPVITNAAAAAAGTVVEAGNLDDGTVVAGTASVSGQLSSSDVDHGATATWSGDADSPLGAFAITAGGHWTYTLDNGAADALAEGESATETFLVTVTDDYGATATETVTITITGTNDSPVITNAAAAAAGTVVEAGNLDDGTVVAGTASVSGQLSSSDVDHGATATWSGDADSPLGAFAITAGGHWTYTLDNGAADALAEGESATETFLVTVTDDYGATATETVTITITGTNDSPVITNAAAAAAGTVVEAGNLDDGTVVAGTASVSGQLSSSDVDHGATATWSGDADSPLGAFAITAGGHWTYTLDNGAADALAEGESATETFLVTVTDDYGATATETVTITITGTNDSPVITNAAAAAAGTVVEAGNLDDGTVVAGTASVSGQLSSSDVDHGATATWSGDADSPLGAFAITAGGHWTYTLDNGAADALAEGESATETFLVTVTDDHGATATETVTITITGTNDSPVITNAAAAAAGTVVEAGNLDDGTVVAGTASVSGQLSSSDVDHGATATWSGDADSPLGAFAITAGGHWTYTLDNGAADALAEGESATETFLVTVTDDYGATATETVTITITGTNDSPVITNAAAAAAGTVVEAGNLDDGTVVAGTASVSGQLSSSDVDHGATATWSGDADSPLGAFAITAGGHWT